MSKKGISKATKLQAPFPYFGGKKSVADIVWKALGQPKHYMEPFCGSAAVLLARPDHDPSVHVESICDKDGFIANAWRSIKYSPDETAKYCDWPVIHADLSARKKVLIENEERLLENLIADDEWHDAKLGGYWIWAASCWIGSGLTSPSQIPHLSDAGMGVHKISQIPHLADAGMGVHKISKIPHLGNAGKGVHKISKIPHLGNAGKGEEVDLDSPYNTNIYAWFRALAERLRYVRIVNGDWKRICGGNWQNKLGPVGIFCDPPYAVADRDQNVYHHDDTTSVAHEVREWCIERGKLESYRIVLAGYEEHEELLLHGWTAQNWKAQGGYGSTKRNADSKAIGSENAKREILYFSPHCLNNKKNEMPLFALENA